MNAPIITVSPEYGYVEATPFNFKLDPFVESQYVKFLWSFGDGSFSRLPSPNHTYKYPKKYNTSVNAYKTDGSYDTYETELNVHLYINDSIYFENVPPPTYASHYNKHPFKINITSQNTGKHLIDLSTQFSKSYQQQLPRNKWSFLRPEWRFLDLDGNIITTIQTIDTPIKINKFGKIDNISGTTVGVTGTAEFYLVDDFYNTDNIKLKQPYTTIIATLQTSANNSFNDSFNLDKTLPSYSNSLASVVLPHTFSWRYPNQIKISENGIRELVKDRWNKAIHPVLIKYTFDDNPIYIDQELKLYNPEINFCHYIPFNETYSESLTVSICGISSNLTPQPTDVLYRDDDGFVKSGYYKGIFNVEPISAENVSIYAQSTIKTPPDLSSNFYNPYIWVSNPEAGMAAAINYFHEDWIDEISTKNLNKAHVKVFDIPVVKPISTASFLLDNHALSGFHGVYSIAALPAPEYQAWMCDSENNMIYKVSTNGEILSSIDIQDIFYKNNLSFLVQRKLFGVTSPAAISLDSEKNIWISLYDTISCLKLDKNGNFLTVASPYGTISITDTISSGSIHYPWFQESSDVYSASGVDVNLMEPTCIDVDIYDNVWVSYSNPLSGYILKYDKNGILAKTITYPVCSCPQEVKCDSYGNVWIVGDQFNLDFSLIPANPSKYLSGFLEKRNSSGVLLSSFGPFNGINHLNLDDEENPWFTYSYHWIGNIDNNTGDLRKLKLTSNSYSDNIPDWVDPNYDLTETALEGIGCDLNGRIFVINSIENKIYVVDKHLDTKNLYIKDFFNINPKGFTYINKNFDEKGETQLHFDYWTKSAQAQGDWTGLRWIKKYAKNKLKYMYNDTDYITLSGSVHNLNFYDKNPYEFFIKNENYDLAKNMKDIAFQPSIRDSNFMFDTFLGSIFGSYPFNHDDLGISSFEKISNFVGIHSDIDTCNVDNLYDMAASVDMGESDDFRLTFPLRIKKLMDNVSINKSKLWGGVIQDNYNFKLLSDTVNFNKGPIIKSINYMITAGTPVVLKTKSTSEYKLINTGYYYSNNVSVLSALEVGLSSYPIAMLADFLSLGYEWDIHYEFYEFSPQKHIRYEDGLIDWNNNQTTLDKSLSSYNDWIKDEGALDTLFAHELYKGLGLI